jgi:hypothetical protein
MARSEHEYLDCPKCGEPAIPSSGTRFVCLGPAARPPSSHSMGSTEGRASISGARRVDE